MDQETLDWLKKFKDGLETGSESFEDLEKRLAAYNKSLKAQQPILQQWGDFFKGRTKEHREVLDQYDAAIKEVTKNTENLSEVEVDARVRKLEAMKAEGMLTASKNKATSAAKEFGKGVAATTNQVAMAALDFVHDLQSGKEGTEIIGAQNIRAAKAAGTLTTSLGRLGTTVGTILTLIPGVGWITRIIGGAVALLGTAASEAAPKMSELAEKGIGILNTEIEKSKKSFRDISSTGAYFGNGMTELRQTARAAGLDITTLGEVVKENSEGLSRFGLGINEAVKRFAGINGEIRNGRLALEFRRLGLDAKQYGAAAIEAAGMLQSSGRLRNMSDTQVAEYTMEYVKNLKVLQNITGEDARKKMEQARQQSMEADLFARAMAEGGEEGVNRLQAALATIPDQLKTGALQYLSTGGRAITDIATRMNMARNPEIEKYFQTMMQGVRDRNASIESVQNSSMDALKQAGKYAIEHYESMGRIGEAGRITGNQILTAGAEIQTALIGVGRRLENVDLKKQQDELNKTIKGGSDALGTSIHTLDEKVLTLQSVLTAKLTPAIEGYADSMQRTYDISKQLADVLESVVKGVAEATGVSKAKQGWQPKPGSGPNDLTGLPGDKRTNAQKMKDDADVRAGRKAYNAFAFDQPNIDPYEVAAAKRGKAKGGISTGPLSGYQEVLHGTEAVVPLPDNRSIPVTMDNSSLTQSLERNNSLLNDIVRVLKQGNKTSSHIARSVA